MKLNVRELRESDWETLTGFWKSWPEWKTPPTKELLPLNGCGGVMICKGEQPVMAGFLYLTNSKVAWLEWIVSNPDYREDDRKEALELLQMAGMIYSITCNHRKSCQTIYCCALKIKF